MPANVETMMYAGAAPWHGLGVHVGAEAIGAADAIRKAGLDWSVDLWPAAATAPLVTPGDKCPRCAIGAAIRGKARVGCDRWREGCTWVAPDGDVVTTDEHFAVVRTGKAGEAAKVLGMVGERYAPVQNTEAFAFLDAVAGPGRLVSYHTAGALNGGRRVWLLAALEDLTIEPLPGDVTTPYLLLSNSHDGGSALRCLFTTVRVVCSNTLNLALRGRAGEGIAIRHTGDLSRKVAEAQRVLGLARETVERHAELARDLARKELGDRAVQAILDDLIPIPDGGRTGRAQNAQATVRDLLEGGPGSDIPGVRGTAWGLLQAITDYTAHHRTTRTDGASTAGAKRLESTWFGSGAALNAKALELVTAAL